MVVSDDVPATARVKSGADGSFRRRPGFDDFDFHHVLGKLLEDVLGRRAAGLGGKAPWRQHSQNEDEQQCGSGDIFFHDRKPPPNPPAPAHGGIYGTVRVMPRAWRSLIAAAARPNSRNTFSLCSPSMGGGVDPSWTRFSNRTGPRTNRNGPALGCSTTSVSPRCLTCGSSSTSATL